MEENNNKTQNQAIVIIGMIALIVALILGVRLVFAGLDAAIPDLKYMASDYEVRHGESVDGSAQSGDTSGAPADGEEAGPSFCPHCGEGMRENFQWGQFCPHCGKKVE